MTAYLVLFASAFLAATILPFYSEITLVAMLTEDFSRPLIWMTATLGNSLGAACNWLLGRYLVHFQDRRWFPFKEEQLGRSQRWFQRYGKWSLLFAWLPVGGDALTFIAGLMRIRFDIFFVLTAIGKGTRYLVVLLLAENFLQMV